MNTEQIYFEKLIHGTDFEEKYDKVKVFQLSKKEFDVMRRLMQFQDRSIRKDVLLTQVWGYDSNATENNVEAYVGFLRKKLKRIGSNLKIESIRLLGYHLEVEESC